MNRSKRIKVNVPTKNLRILCIGDAHFPFTNQTQLKKVYSLVRKYKPTFVIQVGDLYDMYSFSRFARSINVSTPKDEIKQGRAEAEKMWKTIKGIVPNATCFQLRGNHEARIWKSIMTRAPEYESLLEAPIDSLITFPGVTTLPDHRSELVVNGIVFAHGWKSNIGDHAKWFGQSTVCGHLHRGGVVFFPMREKPLFELNCGFMADVDALPLAYGETKTNSWVAGVGYIDEDGPRFIPL